MALIHGGDIAGFRQQYGLEPLDFSASLNPCGMPKRVIEAACAAVQESVAYPDPLARQLTSALGDHLGIDSTWLIMGNGAADCIYRFVDAAQPGHSLIPAPTFAEYARALGARGYKYTLFPLHRENGFALDESFLAAITGDVDAVFVCQPNNPTGNKINPDILHELAHHCHQRNIWLFADECFCDFLDNADAYSLRRFLPTMPRLFILGSFTKLYGMAGIRLGYGICSDTAMIESVRNAGQPWAVSSIAQAAGIAALEENEFVVSSLNLIREEKSGLRAALERLGLPVLGGDANYLFFHTNVANLHEQLARQGILIRDCANFSGLGPGYYRIAVKLPEENARLIRAFESILAPGGTAWPKA